MLPASMQDVFHELTMARSRAAGGDMDDAGNHVLEAVEELKDALGGCGGLTLPVRRLSAYLDQAYFGIKSKDLNGVVAALGSALDMLE